MSIDDFKVAYELMEIIMQSEEWKKIRKNDVRIQTAKKQYEAALRKLDMPKAILDELDSAVLALEEASSDAATLYGIRIAGIIQEVLDNQLVFSQMFLERSAKCGTWKQEKCVAVGSSNASTKKI